MCTFMWPKMLLTWIERWKWRKNTFVSCWSVCKQVNKLRSFELNLDLYFCRHKFSDVVSIDRQVSQFSRWNRSVKDQLVPQGQGKQNNRLVSTEEAPRFESHFYGQNFAQTICWAFFKQVSFREWWVHHVPFKHFGKFVQSYSQVPVYLLSISQQVIYHFVSIKIMFILLQKKDIKKKQITNFIMEKLMFVGPWNLFHWKYTTWQTMRPITNRDQLNLETELWIVWVNILKVTGKQLWSHF